MHIAEGVLSAAVLAGGGLVAVTGTGIGFTRMGYYEIPRVALVSSAFFVASLIHFPVGITSAHLLMIGLSGVLLGWAVFPALLIALFLQAIFFGFGGLVVLGVNTTIMASPGIICYYLFHRFLSGGKLWRVFTAGFGAGAFGVGFGCVLLSLALYLSGKEFINVVRVAVLAHIPIMVAEGFITGSAVVFFARVRPELLQRTITKGG